MSSAFHWSIFFVNYSTTTNWIFPLPLSLSQKKRKEKLESKFLAAYSINEFPLTASKILKAILSLNWRDFNCCISAKYYQIEGKCFGVLYREPNTSTWCCWSFLKDTSTKRSSTPLIWMLNAAWAVSAIESVSSGTSGCVSSSSTPNLSRTPSSKPLQFCNTLSTIVHSPHHLLAFQISLSLVWINHSLFSSC